MYVCRVRRFVSCWGCAQKRIKKIKKIRQVVLDMQKLMASLRSLLSAPHLSWLGLGGSCLFLAAANLGMLTSFSRFGHQRQGRRRSVQPQLLLLLLPHHTALARVETEVDPVTVPDVKLAELQPWPLRGAVTVFYKY